MKKGLLSLFVLVVVCLLANAQSTTPPAYIIDFEADLPEVNHVSPQVVEVIGNVLNNETKEPAGFGYKITMTVSGGPASLSATPINFDYTGGSEAALYNVKAAPSHFQEKNTRVGMASEGYFQTLLSYSLQGWVQDEENLEFTYYRDPSTKMRFELELDNGADLVNIAYQLGDMDYNFVGTSSSSTTCPKGIGTDLENYSCRVTYIDQITILTGVGDNEYTYDDTRITQKDDVFYAKFTDANEDQLVDAQEDGRVSFMETDGNITIYNAGNIGKKIMFDYDDPGFPLEEEVNGLNGQTSSRNRNYHDFDAKNQVMYFLSGMSFDADLCNVDEASLAIEYQTNHIPDHTLLANIADADIPPTHSITYQWSSSLTDCEENFAPIEGATQDSYIVTDITTPTHFRVIATELDANGNEICAISSDCYLFDLCRMDEASLTIEATSNVPNHNLVARVSDANILAGHSISYQWSSSLTDCEKDFTPIDGATRAVYQVRDVTDPIHFKVTAIQLDGNGNEICSISSDCFPLGVANGCVTVDVEGDGLDGVDTSPIEGTIVNLLSSTGDIIRRMTTGADGKYSFPGLPYDNYSIQFIPPNGFEIPTGVSSTIDITIDDDPTRNITNEQTSNIGLFQCTPITPAQKDAEILTGETICMDISGADNYLFSPSENVSQRNGQYCFSPTVTTTYSIQSADPNCGHQAQVTIRVIDKDNTEGKEDMDDKEDTDNTDDTTRTSTGTSTGTGTSADASIPTMSEWGLMIFGLLVLNISVLFLYKQEELLEMS